MKIAVLSDVHGYLTALQAVLAAIKSQRPDYTVFTGDLCVFGARTPNTVYRPGMQPIAGRLISSILLMTFNTRKQN